MRRAHSITLLLIHVSGKLIMCFLLSYRMYPTIRIEDKALFKWNQNCIKAWFFCNKPDTICCKQTKTSSNEIEVWEKLIMKSKHVLVQTIKKLSKVCRENTTYVHLNFLVIMLKIYCRIFDRRRLFRYIK